MTVWVVEGGGLTCGARGVLKESVQHVIKRVISVTNPNVARQINGHSVTCVAVQKLYGFFYFFIFWRRLVFFRSVCYVVPRRLQMA